MKNIKKGIIAIALVFLLTGCIKSNTTMTINKDKSMVFEVKTLLSEKLTSGSEMTTDEESIKAYMDAGFDIKEVSEEGYEGYVISKTYKNIDDVSTTEDINLDMSNFMTGKDLNDKTFFKVEKSFFKNTYTAGYTYKFSVNDYNGSDDGDIIMIPDDEQTVVPSDNASHSAPGDDLTIAPIEDNNDSSSFSDLGDMSELMNLAKEMEFKYVVVLPTKYITTDAKIINEDGKTLTWDLSSEGKSVINYKFSMLNMKNIYLVGGGALALIIIVVVVIIILKKKKKNSVETIPAEGPIHKDFDPSIAEKVDETAPAVSTVPEVTPVVPKVPEVTPVAPVVPEVTPVAPVVPEVTPVAPVVPEVTPVVPEVPEVTPVVPEVPEVTPVAPEVPEVTPVAPEVAPAVLEPQPLSDYEFKLPEEIISVEEKVATEATPVVKTPVFITGIDEEEVVAPTNVNEIQVEMPEIEELNSQNN